MNECEKLIQFNTEAVNRDLTTRFAALKFINQDNYDSMKQQYQAEILDYFDGSYDEFKQKRNKLTQLFVAAGYSSFQESYYRHSLSPEGAQAYAVCVAKSSCKPIAAWIQAVVDDRLTIGVRCGLTGNVKVKYQVFGEKPLNDPSELTGGATEVLLFPYDPNKSFLVAINAIVLDSGAKDSTVIDLPRIRRFEIRKSQKEFTGIMMCGAGCQGNTALCGIYRDVTIAADQDYYLIPATMKSKEDIIGGPGLAHYNVKWVEDCVNGRVTRMVGHPYGFEGQSGDTQGIVHVTYSVTGEREYIVEVAN